ncbi:unnamed protein product [Miscanthus lutarioriparius]|uniref:Uncharacterized protein n=1 Tax=Miscanthus lutarioriparius TaxID=422564 RepID=A0A811QDZ8_9POAL|nr:unnamed protein product [Miscanthus lutarioriparius]
MAVTHQLLRLLVTLLLVATLIGADDSPPAPTPQPQPTAYQMLERYNFTQGILPQGVTGYVLNADGSFEVYLPADCGFRAGSMQVQYSSRVAGHIQPLSITGLEGVKVKVLFSWIGVDQVDRDGDQLRFSAGPLSKSFSIDTFANSPQCS